MDSRSIHSGTTLNRVASSDNVHEINNMYRKNEFHGWKQSKKVLLKVVSYLKQWYYTVATYTICGDNITNMAICCKLLSNQVQ